MNFDVKKFLLTNFPYVFMAWLCNRIGEGYRLASGADELDKAMSAISVTLSFFASVFSEIREAGVSSFFCFWRRKSRGKMTEPSLQTSGKQ